MYTMLDDSHDKENYTPLKLWKTNKFIASLRNQKVLIVAFVRTYIKFYELV